MPQVLVRDVLSRVTALLQDKAPQFTRYVEADLLRWLNDAHVAIVTYLPTAGARIDALRLKAGTRQSIALIQATDCKPSDGSTQSSNVTGHALFDVLRNMGADGLTAGRAIRIADRDDLDLIDRDWHTKTATVVQHYMHDPRQPTFFYAYPAVPSAGLWVEVSYSAMPARLDESVSYVGDAITTIRVPDEHVPDLVNYIVARALMQETNFGSKGDAAAFANLFSGSINTLAQQRLGTNPNLTRLPLAPAPQGQAS